MKKKVLSMALASAMAVSLFGGVTVSAEESEIGGSLIIWEHSDQFTEPLKAVVAGFNEKYPDVDVQIEVKTSDQYYNLLQTAMQAGETPDLFWTNGLATTHYKSYVDAGYLMDLTDAVDFSLYEGTTAMNIVTMEDGKVYSTPTAETGGRCVYYNKDIFEELGIEVPKTFSEFEAALAKIAESDYTPIAFSATDPWAILFQFEPVLNGMSVDWVKEYEENGTIKVNDERVVAAFDKMLEWAEKGYYGKGYLGVDESGALLAFSKGEAAMCVEGTWNISTIDENNPELNYGAFQIPTEDGEQPMVGTNSCGYGVSATTENPDAALAFANYFASVDGQTRWINALSSIPCTTQIVSDNAVVNEIASFDYLTESYYNILGYLADPEQDDTATAVWESDQCKVFAGALGVQEFVDSLQSLLVE
jgi:raffinose/stachyose/melibiose transport system substrate-binding protein